NCSATKSNYLRGTGPYPTSMDWRKKGNFVSPVKNQVCMAIPNLPPKKATFIDNIPGRKTQRNHKTTQAYSHLYFFLTISPGLFLCKAREVVTH
ncbi:Hypothetical predicted protein, partial [Marmota monax]